MRGVHHHGLEPLGGHGDGHPGRHAGGLVTGLLHTACGIPAILAGILTQLALYSINLRIMAIGDETATTKATLALSVDNDHLLLSSRFVRNVDLSNPLIPLAIITAVVIALLYLFFGTELGSAPAGHRRQPGHGPGPGHQHQLRQGAGAGHLQRPGGPVRRPAGPVPGQLHNDMGRGAIVIGLAAVIIGEVLLSRVFQNFALKLLYSEIARLRGHHPGAPPGPESTDLKLLTALVVAIFLAIPFWKGRYFSGHGHARKGGASHA